MSPKDTFPNTAYEKYRHMEMKMNMKSMQRSMVRGPTFGIQRAVVISDYKNIFT